EAEQVGSVKYSRGRASGVVFSRSRFSILSRGSRSTKPAITPRSAMKKWVENIPWQRFINCWRIANLGWAFNRESARTPIGESAGKPQRLHLVLAKLICIQLLQEMFSVLAEEFSCAKAIRYEEFCERPREAFQSAAAALYIAWDASMEGYLGKTMQADSTSAD